ncbi:hypothetical protein Bca4012_092875 [Brassica carinata]
MPSSKPPKLCTLLLTMFVLYYLVFSPQLRFYICFDILFQLLHGNDELLITDMPKEEVESLFDAYKDSDFTRTGSINGL